MSVLNESVGSDPGFCGKTALGDNQGETLCLFSIYGYWKTFVATAGSIRRTDKNN